MTKFWLVLIGYMPDFIKKKKIFCDFMIFPGILNIRYFKFILVSAYIQGQNCFSTFLS